MRFRSICTMAVLLLCIPITFAQQADKSKRDLNANSSQPSEKKGKQDQQAKGENDSLARQQTEKGAFKAKPTPITSKEELEAKYSIESTRFREDGKLRSIVGDIQLENATGDFETDAVTFLNEIAPLYGYRDLLSEYQVKSKSSYIIVFQQYYQGVPVIGSSIKIVLSKSNTFTLIQGNYIPDISVNSIPSLGIDQAIGIAVDDIGTDRSNCNIVDTLIIRKFNEQLHLVWSLDVYDTLAPPGYEYSVDAHTGIILKKARMGVHIDVENSSSRSGRGNQ